MPTETSACVSSGASGETDEYGVGLVLVITTTLS